MAEEASSAAQETAQVAEPVSTQAELQIVYEFDDNKVFTRIIQSTKETPLTTNQTLVKPADGLYTPITWDGTKWVGTDQATFEAKQEADRQAYLAAHPHVATPMETALASLSYQQMEAQSTISDLQTANAQMAYQIMNNTNGGTN